MYLKWNIQNEKFCIILW